MFCTKCGTDLPDDSRFCRGCGHTLGAVSTGGGAAAAPARVAPVPAKPKSRFTYWHYVALLILVFLAGTWYVQNKSSNPLPVPTQSARVPQPQLHTQGTGDKAFTVNAGGVYYFTFEMPTGAFNATLKGHFAASGGAGNDVEAFVVSEDDFVNWRNGHSVKALYNSGRVTQETLNVFLPTNPGKYILVFSNKFSLLTPKAVQADVQLNYYTR
jgi:zinc-ribbon domain